MIAQADRFQWSPRNILCSQKERDIGYLDAVRVLKKYPGKRHYKGNKIGELSGQSTRAKSLGCLGYSKCEGESRGKTVHPCHFPIALAQRIIAATTEKGDRVLDPFAGVGTTAQPRFAVSADLLAPNCCANTKRLRCVEDAGPATRDSVPTSGKPCINLSKARRNNIPLNWRSVAMGGDSCGTKRDRRGGRHA